MRPCYRQELVDRKGSFMSAWVKSGHSQCASARRLCANGGGNGRSPYDHLQTNAGAPPNDFNRLNLGWLDGSGGCAYWHRQPCLYSPALKVQNKIGGHHKE